eukprot:TRINITY_DN1296_c0_g2_i1.p1 TRINITY_DN1296_c0_g2~~TRINITY_DN1296_c0_g2_i1.p1  ORF type:complete len:187 (-),score=24.69 TRINITY_DN1296_c0_g2_i1:117-608(-)
MGRKDSRSRSRSGGGGVDVDRIQDMVDERQEARRSRDFDKADRMRDELRDMNVRVDDTELTWNGPGGTRGNVNNPGGKGGGGGGGAPRVERRDGDWDCPNCGKLVFASKDTCFSCGEPKPRGGGRDRYDSRDRGRGGGRRSSRYDDDRSDRRRGRDESRGRRR